MGNEALPSEGQTAFVPREQHRQVWRSERGRRWGPSLGPSSQKNESTRGLRSHQKGHMNVYYIEKRNRKKRCLKLYFQDLKKQIWNAKGLPCFVYL